MPSFAALSTKTAIGFWALWKDDYSNLLFETMSKLYHPEHGFYEGYYENSSNIIQTFTANSNGIILEILLYRKLGPLLNAKNFINSKWELIINNKKEYRDDNINNCRPSM